MPSSASLLAILSLSALALSGCVGAVTGAAVEASTAVAVGAVKGVGAVGAATVKTTGKVVGAAIPDKKKDGGR